MRTRISGTGLALPDRVVTNEELARRVDTSDEWIVKRTGIHERRILEEGRSASDLATEAGLRACAAASIDVKELDCIICCTVTPDMPMPAVAVTVQHKLGAGPCAAFDMAAACAGFVYGLTVGDALVKSGQYRRVLVIGVEVMTRTLDWSDRGTCVLFGDGAGAVVLTPSTDERGILSTHLFADGAGVSLLQIPAGGSREPASAKTVAEKRHALTMKGKPLFTHAVRNLAAAAEAALSANGLSAKDVDCVVAHQANLRILEAVAERAGMPLEKFFINIQKYGNTSSASVPIALDEAVREGKVHAGSHVLLLALGAGLTWGGALVKW